MSEPSLSAEADAALVARVRASDDPGAFRAIYDRYRGELLAFLVRLLGDPAQAEDALQDAFTRAYLALDRYDPKRPFRPWLYRIARNASLDAIRRRAKDQRIVSTVAHQETGPEAPAEPERREGIERLQAALASLPPESRALLIQRHGLCMKLDDLATSFGCTERTIRNRLRRAAADLAQALVHARGAAE